MRESQGSPGPAGLAGLRERIARDLELLDFPPPAWVASPSSTDGGPHHVVVVGAGMLGLTIGFALRRLGVHDVVVLDAAARGHEGPWVTYARMRTLRSPKHLAGPAQGVPSLTFRAWFEAQHGAKGWEALGRIPRETWMDYLRWYRDVLDITVRNGVRVCELSPVAEAGEDRCNFVLTVEGPDGPAELRARKVVLATGREGMAVPRIPEHFAPHVGTRCFHSADDIDFTALRDRRVAVIGLGASAFDNAAEALEAGARSVVLLGRARALPRLNKGKAIVYAGFTEGFPALPDPLHVELLGHVFSCRIAPPRAAVTRVAGHPRFRLRLGTAVRAVRERGQGLELELEGGGALAADAVILGTGFRIDVTAPREIRGFADEILRWRDRLAELPAEAHCELLDFPYLGPGLELVEREAGRAPHLRHLHCFNFAAALSHGNVSGDIPAVSEGAERLARGLVRNLFLEDVEHHRRALLDYAEPELFGDEIEAASWWPPIE